MDVANHAKAPWTVTITVDIAERANSDHYCTIAGTHFRSKVLELQKNRFEKPTIRRDELRELRPLATIYTD